MIRPPDIKFPFSSKFSFLKARLGKPRAVCVSCAPLFEPEFPRNYPFSPQVFKVSFLKAWRTRKKRISTPIGTVFINFWPPLFLFLSRPQPIKILAIFFVVAGPKALQAGGAKQTIFA